MDTVGRWFESSPLDHNTLTGGSSVGRAADANNRNLKQVKDYLQQQIFDYTCLVKQKVSVRVRLRDTSLMV